jgi:hypothetical protein
MKKSHAAVALLGLVLVAGCTTTGGTARITTPSAASRAAPVETATCLAMARKLADSSVGLDESRVISFKRNNNSQLVIKGPVTLRRASAQGAYDYRCYFSLGPNGHSQFEKMTILARSATARQ